MGGCNTITGFIKLLAQRLYQSSMKSEKSWMSRDLFDCDRKCQHKEDSDSKEIKVFFKNGMEISAECLQPPSQAKYAPRYDLFMPTGCSQDHWCHVHDIWIRGMLLKYSGRGRSHGYAHAKSALDPANHYFEIEILDHGQDCYIAIGLACRNYHKHKYSGWHLGSMCYLADNGHIHMGASSTRLGPICRKGDTMGCGIHFPRHYCAEMDTDETLDEQVYNLTNFTFDTGEEFDPVDEEDWWLTPSDGMSSQMVKVYFTRNGINVGSREILLPKRGLYPVVAMKSKGDTVLVNLRPMTG